MGKMVGVAEFKANCTRLLREMQQDGEPIIVTNRGKVVGVMSPPPEPDRESLFGCMKGAVSYADDDAGPAWDEPWNAENGIIFNDEEQEREDRKRSGLEP